MDTVSSVFILETMSVPSLAIECGDSKSGGGTRLLGGIWMLRLEAAAAVTTGGVESLEE